MIKTIHFLKSKYMKLFATVLTASNLLNFVTSIIDANETLHYILAALALAIGVFLSVGVWTFSLQTSLTGAKMLKIIFKIKSILAWIAVALVTIVGIILITDLPVTGELAVEVLSFVFLFAILTVVAQLVIEAKINGNLLNLVRDMTRRIEYGYKGEFISKLAGWSFAGIIVIAIQLVIIVLMYAGLMAYAYGLGLTVSFHELMTEALDGRHLSLFLGFLSLAIAIVGYIVNIKLIRAYIKNVVPENAEEEIPEITAAE